MFHLARCLGSKVVRGLENTMKAIVYDKYGPPDVLKLQVVDRPTVSDDDVLVQVRAASVNPYDWHFMRGEPYFMRLMIGLLRPKSNRLGADLAGRVEQVGKNVTGFRPGDEVFGDTGGGPWGSFGEFVCVPENWLDLKPADLTFEQAAAVPLAGITALQGLRDWGDVQPGQQVLIIGASGGVGTFAVQIAKSFGAEVTGVCSTRNAEMVRSLGADHVIDYTQEDFSRRGKRYDLIFQLAGTLSPSGCRRALTPGGTLVLSSGEGGRWFGPLGRMLEAMVSGPFVGQKMVSRVARQSKADLGILKQLIETGKVTPLIDRSYSFEEIPEAIRYLEEGHARGKVVVTV
jgi:NADPH:quinone reductase-like Zn-dependent oxidoreductase